MRKHFKQSELKEIEQHTEFSRRMDKTLNLHFTDRCNFSCKHCFVYMTGRELNLDECKSIIDKISEMNQFSRINLAGGEPMLAPHLQDVIDYVVLKGFECSMITNGSLLTEQFIIHNKKKLSMIGISIDSIDDDTNNLIGRKTIEDIEYLAKLIKLHGMKLKINICVSKLNIHVDFISIIEQLQPDRLKILQVLSSPHLKNANKFLISDKEFSEICQTLDKYHPICENNKYMKESYWIVDSEGCYGKDNLHLGSSSKIKLI